MKLIAVRRWAMKRQRMLIVGLTVALLLFTLLYFRGTNAGCREEDYGWRRA